ncbi:MAG: FTR1 family protein [Rubrivivax sp.]
MTPKLLTPFLVGWRCLLALAALGLLLIAPPAAAAGLLPAQALDLLVQQGDAAAAGHVADAAGGERTAAQFSRLYFDVFEGAGLELSLGAHDRARVTRIEHGFAQCIRLALERQPPAALQAGWQALRGELLAARPLIEQVQSQQGGQAFWQALLIVAREGAEAILLVAALAAFLQRSGQAHRRVWLWGGVAGGLALSALLAWLVSGLLAAAGSLRGLLLGLMVLLAALMTAQMAAWMYARRSAERWNRALQAHIAGAADLTPWLIAGVALVAVLREGAETLLFFQALIGSAPGQTAALLGGAAAAVAVLALLFAAMQFVGRRAPLTLFFVGTASLLLVMAVVLAGKGVLQVQLAGALPTHAWPWLPTVDWLGLHPSREGVLAQAGVLLFALALALRPAR